MGYPPGNKVQPRSFLSRLWYISMAAAKAKSHKTNIYLLGLLIFPFQKIHQLLYLRVQ